MQLLSTLQPVHVVYFAWCRSNAPELRSGIRNLYPTPEAGDAVIVMIMGVSGSGKTTLGVELARRLGWTLLDCDDLHPQANIEKMRRGFPLDDADRAPWLNIIAQKLRDLSRSRASAVVACSALKRAYRHKLISGCSDLLLVYLRVQRQDTERRLLDRRGHFMPVQLLESQFATLEEPTAEELSVALDAQAPLEKNVCIALEAISNRLGEGAI
ncbi:MAG TPA: gluconokinase, GntK/IdnK-type [Steroidobacteraceae bacterium]